MLKVVYLLVIGVERWKKSTKLLDTLPILEGWPVMPQPIPSSLKFSLVHSHVFYSDNCLYCPGPSPSHSPHYLGMYVVLRSSTLTVGFSVLL